MLLASCGGAATPASTGDTYTSPNLPKDYEGALPVRNQLALGIIELNQSPLATTHDQAKTLIHLWQVLRMGTGSGQPGQGQSMSPEARATKQTAEGVTSSSASGSKLSSALTDAVIASPENLLR